MIIDKRNRCAIDPTQYIPADCLEQILTKEIVTAADPNLEVFVISIAFERQYFEIKDNYAFTGYFRCKLDQLKLLGFHSIVVSIIKFNKETVEESVVK